MDPKSPPSPDCDWTLILNEGNRHGHPNGHRYSQVYGDLRGHSDPQANGHTVLENIHKIGLSGASPLKILNGHESDSSIHANERVKNDVNGKVYDDVNGDVKDHSFGHVSGHSVSEVIHKSGPRRKSTMKILNWKESSIHVNANGDVSGDVSGHINLSKRHVNSNINGHASSNVNCHVKGQSVVEDVPSPMKIANDHGCKSVSESAVRSARTIIVLRNDCPMTKKAEHGETETSCLKTCMAFSEHTLEILRKPISVTTNGSASQETSAERNPWNGQPGSEETTLNSPRPCTAMVKDTEIRKSVFAQATENPYGNTISSDRDNSLNSVESNVDHSSTGQCAIFEDPAVGKVLCLSECVTNTQGQDNILVAVGQGKDSLEDNYPTRTGSSVPIELPEKRQQNGDQANVGSRHKVPIEKKNLTCRLHYLEDNKDEIESNGSKWEAINCKVGDTPLTFHYGHNDDENQHYMVDVMTYERDNHLCAWVSAEVVVSGTPDSTEDDQRPREYGYEPENERPREGGYSPGNERLREYDHEPMNERPREYDHAPGNETSIEYGLELGNERPREYDHEPRNERPRDTQDDEARGEDAAFGPEWGIPASIGVVPGRQCLADVDISFLPKPLLAHAYRTEWLHCQGVGVRMKLPYTWPCIEKRLKKDIPVFAYVHPDTVELLDLIRLALTCKLTGEKGNAAYLNVSSNLREVLDKLRLGQPLENASTASAVDRRAEPQASRREFLQEKTQHPKTWSSSNPTPDTFQSHRTTELAVTSSLETQLSQVQKTVVLDNIKRQIQQVPSECDHVDGILRGHAEDLNALLSAGTSDLRLMEAMLEGQSHFQYTKQAFEDLLHRLQRFATDVEADDLTMAEARGLGLGEILDTEPSEMGLPDFNRCVAEGTRLEVKPVSPKPDRQIDICTDAENLMKMLMSMKLNWESNRRLQRTLMNKMALEDHEQLSPEYVFYHNYVVQCMNVINTFCETTVYFLVQILSKISGLSPLDLCHFSQACQPEAADGNSSLPDQVMSFLYQTPHRAIALCQWFCELLDLVNGAMDSISKYTSHNAGVAVQQANACKALEDFFPKLCVLFRTYTPYLLSEFAQQKTSCQIDDCEGLPVVFQVKEEPGDCIKSRPAPNSSGHHAALATLPSHSTADREKEGSEANTTASEGSPNARHVSSYRRRSLETWAMPIPTKEFTKLYRQKVNKKKGYPGSPERVISELVWLKIEENQKQIVARCQNIRDILAQRLQEMERKDGSASSEHSPVYWEHVAVANAKWKFHNYTLKLLQSKRRQLTEFVVEEYGVAKQEIDWHYQPVSQQLSNAKLPVMTQENCIHQQLNEDQFYHSLKQVQQLCDDILDRCPDIFAATQKLAWKIKESSEVNLIVSVEAISSINEREMEVSKEDHLPIRLDDQTPNEQTKSENASVRERERTEELETRIQENEDLKADAERPDWLPSEWADSTFIREQQEALKTFQQLHQTKTRNGNGHQQPEQPTLLNMEDMVTMLETEGSSMEWLLSRLQQVLEENWERVPYIPAIPVKCREARVSAVNDGIALTPSGVDGTRQVSVSGVHINVIKTVFGETSLMNLLPTRTSGKPDSVTTEADYPSCASQPESSFGSDVSRREGPNQNAPGRKKVTRERVSTGSRSESHSHEQLESTIRRAECVNQSVVHREQDSQSKGKAGIATSLPQPRARKRTFDATPGTIEAECELVVKKIRSQSQPSTSVRSSSLSSSSAPLGRPPRPKNRLPSAPPFDHSSTSFNQDHAMVLEGVSGKGPNGIRRQQPHHSTENVLSSHTLPIDWSALQNSGSDDSFFSAVEEIGADGTDSVFGDLSVSTVEIESTSDSVSVFSDDASPSCADRNSSDHDDSPPAESAEKNAQDILRSVPPRKHEKETASGDYENKQYRGKLASRVENSTGILLTPKPHEVGDRATGMVAESNAKGTNDTAVPQPYTIVRPSWNHPGPKYEFFAKEYRESHSHHDDIGPAYNQFRIRPSCPDTRTCKVLSVGEGSSTRYRPAEFQMPSARDIDDVFNRQPALPHVPYPFPTEGMFDLGPDACQLYRNEESLSQARQARNAYWELQQEEKKQKTTSEAELPRWRRRWKESEHFWTSRQNTILQVDHTLPKKRVTAMRPSPELIAKVDPRPRLQPTQRTSSSKQQPKQSSKEEKLCIQEKQNRSRKRRNQSGIELNHESNQTESLDNSDPSQSNREQSQTNTKRNQTNQGPNQSSRKLIQPSAKSNQSSSPQQIKSPHRGRQYLWENKLISPTSPSKEKLPPAKSPRALLPSCKHPASLRAASRDPVLAISRLNRPSTVVMQTPVENPAKENVPVELSGKCNEVSSTATRENDKCLSWTQCSSLSAEDSDTATRRVGADRCWQCERLKRDNRQHCSPSDHHHLLASPRYSSLDSALTSKWFHRKVEGSLQHPPPVQQSLQRQFKSVKPRRNRQSLITDYCIVRRAWSYTSVKEGMPLPDKRPQDCEILSTIKPKVSEVPSAFVTSLHTTEKADLFKSVTESNDASTPASSRYFTLGEAILKANAYYTEDAASAPKTSIEKSLDERGETNFDTKAPESRKTRRSPPPEEVIEVSNQSSPPKKSKGEEEEGRISTECVSAETAENGECKKAEKRLSPNPHQDEENISRPVGSPPKKAKDEKERQKQFSKQYITAEKHCECEKAEKKTSPSHRQEVDSVSKTDVSPPKKAKGEERILIECIAETCCDCRKAEKRKSPSLCSTTEKINQTGISPPKKAKEEDLDTEVYSEDEKPEMEVISSVLSTPKAHCYCKKAEKRKSHRPRSATESIVPTGISPLKRAREDLEDEKFVIENLEQVANSPVRKPRTRCNCKGEGQRTSPSLCNVTGLTEMLPPKGAEENIGENEQYPKDKDRGKYAAESALMPKKRSSYKKKEKIKFAEMNPAGISPPIKAKEVRKHEESNPDVGTAKSIQTSSETQTEEAESKDLFSYSATKEKVNEKCRVASKDRDICESLRLSYDVCVLESRCSHQGASLSASTSLSAIKSVPPTPTKISSLPPSQDHFSKAVATLKCLEQEQNTETTIKVTRRKLLLRTTSQIADVSRDVKDRGESRPTMKAQKVPNSEQPNDRNILNNTKLINIFTNDGSSVFKENDCRCIENDALPKNSSTNLSTTLDVCSQNSGNFKTTAELSSKIDNYVNNNFISPSLVILKRKSTRTLATRLKENSENVNIPCSDNTGCHFFEKSGSLSSAILTSKPAQKRTPSLKDYRKSLSKANLALTSNENSNVLPVVLPRTSSRKKHIPQNENNENLVECNVGTKHKTKTCSQRSVSTPSLNSRVKTIANAKTKARDAFTSTPSTNISKSDNKTMSGKAAGKITDTIGVLEPTKVRKNYNSDITGVALPELTTSTTTQNVTAKPTRKRTIPSTEITCDTSAELFASTSPMRFASTPKIPTNLRTRLSKRIAARLLDKRTTSTFASRSLGERTTSTFVAGSKEMTRVTGTAAMTRKTRSMLETKGKRDSSSSNYTSYRSEWRDEARHNMAFEHIRHNELAEEQVPCMEDVFQMDSNLSQSVIGDGDGSTWPSFDFVQRKSRDARARSGFDISYDSSKQSSKLPLKSLQFFPSCDNLAPPRYHRFGDDVKGKKTTLFSLEDKENIDPSVLNELFPRARILSLNDEQETGRPWRRSRGELTYTAISSISNRRSSRRVNYAKRPSIPQRHQSL